MCVFGPPAGGTASLASCNTGSNVMWGAIGLGYSAFLVFGLDADTEPAWLGVMRWAGTATLASDSNEPTGGPGSAIVVLVAG